MVTHLDEGNILKGSYTKIKDLTHTLWYYIYNSNMSFIIAASVVNSSSKKVAYERLIAPGIFCFKEYNHWRHLANFATNMHKCWRKNILSSIDLEQHILIATMKKMWFNYSQQQERECDLTAHLEVTAIFSAQHTTTRSGWWPMDRDGGSEGGGGGSSPPTACVIKELFFSLLWNFLL
jgi:hypothetical protein